MADFRIPFSKDGDRRFPVTTESEQGHLCGEADRTLFNGLQYRLEAEVGHVIDFAGIAMTDDRMTQLREAIQALILAATGGGDTAEYVLMSQARSRLPFFPDVQTPEGTLGVIVAGLGSIMIPPAITFLHRGIYPINTGDTDDAGRTFATNASKTYHLRWSYQNGYTLNDVAGSYNSNALVESDKTFDSTYDDMLIARIITNSSNAATITNLVNKVQLSYQGRLVGNDGIALSGSPYYAVTRNLSFEYDFARAPRHISTTAMIGTGGNLSPGVLQSPSRVTDIVTDRYHTSFLLAVDYNNTVTQPFYDAYLMASA